MPIYPINTESIKERYDRYNASYFGGILPKCRFHLIREKTNQFGRYTWSHGRDGGMVGHIWISKHVNWTEDALQEVIIHEMIHHYLQIIKGKHGGVFGHNWRFRRECRKMKKRYGLVIRSHCFHLMHLKTW